MSFFFSRFLFRQIIVFFMLFWTKQKNKKPSEDLGFYCYLNQDENEEIQSLFFNKLDDSFVVCSSYNNLRLKCRSIKLRHIEFGISKGTEIFESEIIKYPGWLEYDDQKHRILTYNHLNQFLTFFFLSPFVCFCVFRFFFTLYYIS